MVWSAKVFQICLEICYYSLPGDYAIDLQYNRKEKNFINNITT